MKRHPKLNEVEHATVVMSACCLKEVDVHAGNGNGQSARCPECGKMSAVIRKSVPAELVPHILGSENADELKRAGYIQASTFADMISGKRLEFVWQRLEQLLMDDHAHARLGRHFHYVAVFTKDDCNTADE